MSQYSYQGSHKIKVLYVQLGGVLGFIISTLVAGFAFSGIWIVPRQGNSSSILDDPRLTLICFAAWFILIGWSVSFTLINYLPTIWVDEDGLQISAYLFFRIRIPWSAIVDIGSGSLPKRYLLVRARRISLFHRAFGWLYSRTFYPGFLIERHITDWDGLIKEITRRAKLNSVQVKK
jgi:hypothetical protein